MPYSALRPLRQLRRLPVPRARQVRRRGARRAAGARASERHAADERRGGQARDERRPAPRSPRSSSSGTARPRRYAADLVVLACGAANTAKLLLASANDKHPNGLANGSDQVGRNYMFHDSLAVLALSQEENPTIFQKTLGLNDFYFGGDGFDYPLGQHPDGRQVAGADVPRREAAARRSSRREWTLERVAKHAIDFWLSTEDLPQPENRVTRRRRRQAHARATRPTNDEPKKRALRAAQVDARQAAHGPGPPVPPLRVHEERDPGRRRRAPGGHVPVRRRPGDVGR